jgi:hypothetical protein
MKIFSESGLFERRSQNIGRVVRKGDRKRRKVNHT